MLLRVRRPRCSAGESDMLLSAGVGGLQFLSVDHKARRHSVVATIGVANRLERIYHGSLSCQVM